MKYCFSPKRPNCSTFNLIVVVKKGWQTKKACDAHYIQTLDTKPHVHSWATTLSDWPETHTSNLGDNFREWYEYSRCFQYAIICWVFLRIMQPMIIQIAQKTLRQMLFNHGFQNMEKYTIRVSTYSAIYCPLWTKVSFWLWCAQCHNMSFSKLHESVTWQNFSGSKIILIRYDWYDGTVNFLRPCDIWLLGDIRVAIQWVGGEPR